MKVRMEIPAPRGFPFFGWDETSTKHYFESSNLKKGDHVMVYNGQGGFHEYRMATVEEPALGRQKRVVLSVDAAWGGSTFYRSGRNCYSPTGQSRMLPPIKALMPYFAEAEILSLRTRE